LYDFKGIFALFIRENISGGIPVEGCNGQKGHLLGRNNAFGQILEVAMIIIIIISITSTSL
jgi:hypothetical protein